LPEAIAAPRLSNRNTPTTQAEAGIRDTALGAALLARGHQLDPGDYLGHVTGVAFLPDGRLQAAAEPGRARGGSATGVRPARRPSRPTGSSSPTAGRADARTSRSCTAATPTRCSSGTGTATALTRSPCAGGPSSSSTTSCGPARPPASSSTDGPGTSSSSATG